MRGVVFIAWGGNQKLAEQVRDALSEKDIDAQVGGHDYGAGDRKYYLGDQIFEQMQKASQAIILAQPDMNDQSTKSTSRLRPNLMLEWGYLCKSLPAESMHVFLIGLKKSELPSDLVGSWAEEINLDNIENIEEASEEIVELFMKNKRMYRVDPFDVFVNWPTWKDFIIKQLRGEQAANPYRLSQVLLHAIRPVYYYNDFKFLGTAIQKIGEVEAELEQSAELATAALHYHMATGDHITTIDSEQQVSNFDSFWSITQLLKEQAENGKYSYEVDPWYNVVNKSYIGLCFQKMAKSPNMKDEEVRKHKQDACLNFKESLDIIQNSIKHKDDYNDIDYHRARELWLGFVFRNYGRSLCEIGEVEKGLEYLDRAISARRKVLNFLSINAIGDDLSTAYMGNTRIHSNILFSQYLLEVIRPMIDIVRFKIELKDKGASEFSDYDCCNDIRQFIHIVSEDNYYHQPYIVRQKLCSEMKNLANKIKDEDVLSELKKLT